MQVTRKVITVGNSLGVTFPREFVKKNRIKAGATVLAQANNGEIKFSVNKPEASLYQPMSDKEFIDIIQDIEMECGEALEKLAKLS